MARMWVLWALAKLDSKQNDTLACLVLHSCLTLVCLCSLIRILCQIVKGFGANLLVYDVFEADCVKEMGGKYVSKEEIYKTCDVIFLMMPLLPATKHTINSEVLPLLKKGVIIINTSRGGLIETSALLDGIQRGIIGGAGIDVYENEVSRLTFSPMLLTSFNVTK
jgi:lactate dehydrogenase-like 2-hydroxyacid dehydrogenase